MPLIFENNGKTFEIKVRREPQKKLRKTAIKFTSEDITKYGKINCLHIAEAYFNMPYYTEAHEWDWPRFHSLCQTTDRNPDCITGTMRVEHGIYLTLNDIITNKDYLILPQISIHFDQSGAFDAEDV